MIAALLYLQYHSIKNRTLLRLKRLKQPKYLLGGIVGGLYFYFYFFRWLFAGRGQRTNLLGADSPDMTALYESIGALIFLTIVLLAWVVPHQRAALAFTEAEVAFLFPAPVSRRGLIHFKLLRSQTAIFFTTVLLTLVTNRFGGAAWIRAAGWWLILSTLNLHFLGSSFARTMLLERGISNWQRRTAILALLLVSGGIVFAWARRTLPALDPAELYNLDAIQDYVRKVLVSGPVPYLLFPCRLVVRPFLAPDARAFLSALVPAALLILLHYWWVIRSDVAFEEASVEASKKLADKVAAIRAGNWQTTGKKAKVRRAPFNLRPMGSPAVALLWKNLISAGQAFTLRFGIMLAFIGIVSCIALRNTTGNLVPLIGMMAGVLMFWSLLIGPQFLRQDLRQDLVAAEVLKTFPMRGWQIALGEVLAPATILTSIQWCLLIVAIGLFSQNLVSTFGWLGSLMIGLGLALLLPMVNLITFQIPNAAVLLFPAWFQAGKEGPQGIEATGQRLIFLLGQLLVFIIALVPAGAVSGGVFFLVKLVLGLPAALAAALFCASVVLGIEAALGLMLLGWLFERFDLSSELNP